MEYSFDLVEFLRGFDVELESDLVYYDSQDGIATLIDSESGELLIIETLH